ncbi:hypothetical protein [Rhizobium sp. SG_E_25_P2]|uniref:hypothetical protein n=1 Tax=Rhizobium sp. SG_E_25_P2 TaxID=2879942 RepID=UPI002473BB32|nr:hypothetical protein [Rhizobium sp. SG_E_25_P2]
MRLGHERSLLLLAAGISILATPALAGDCDAVADAYDLLSKAPAYRQLTSLDGKPLLDSIAVGDDLYVKDGESWTKTSLEKGQRAAMTKRMVPDAASLKDCAAAGDETLDGAAMHVYDYTPPAVQGVGDPGPQRVWIGADDGLPHRMASESTKTDVRLQFDNITAPAP